MINSNKYLIPICDIEAGNTWIHTIIAKSITECKEKLMAFLIEYYDDFDEYSNYSEFVSKLDSEHNILIGSIKDIDEI